MRPSRIWPTDCLWKQWVPQFPFVGVLMSFETLEITVIVLLAVVVLLLKWSDRFGPGPLAQTKLPQQPGKEGLQPFQNPVATVTEDLD